MKKDIGQKNFNLSLGMLHDFPQVHFLRLTFINYEQEKYINDLPILQCFYENLSEKNSTHLGQVTF